MRLPFLLEMTLHPIDGSILPGICHHESAYRAVLWSIGGDSGWLNGGRRGVQRCNRGCWNRILRRYHEGQIWVTSAGSRMRKGGLEFLRFLSWFPTLVIPVSRVNFGTEFG